VRNREDRHRAIRDGHHAVLHLAQQPQVADELDEDDRRLLRALTSGGEGRTRAASGARVEGELGGKLAIAAQISHFGGCGSETRPPP